MDKMTKKEAVEKQKEKSQRSENSVVAAGTRHAHLTDFSAGDSNVLFLSGFLHFTKFTFSESSPIRDKNGTDRGSAESAKLKNAQVRNCHLVDIRIGRNVIEL